MVKGRTGTASTPVCRHVFIECLTLRNRRPHAYQVRCPYCDLEGPVCRDSETALEEFFSRNPNVGYVWRGGLKFRSARELADYKADSYGAGGM